MKSNCQLKYSFQRNASILFCCLIFVLISCNQKRDPKSDNKISPDETQLVKANKRIVRSEKELIDDYIVRYGLHMKETGSGLRYLIYKQSDGIRAEKNMIALISYEVRLLDGNLIYSSAKSGNKKFIIGRGGIESGLEEGILYMKNAEQAKFIIPSHLAFGLVGDGKKIPSRAVLVYDVELLKLIKQ